MVSGDGEYEYFKTVAANDIPRFLALLGSEPDADVLAVLEASWSGDATYELERRVREGSVPVDDLERVSSALWLPVRQHVDRRPVAGRRR